MKMCFQQYDQGSHQLKRCRSAGGQAQKRIMHGRTKRVVLRPMQLASRKCGAGHEGSQCGHV